MQEVKRRAIINHGNNGGQKRNLLYLNLVYHSLWNLIGYSVTNFDSFIFCVKPGRWKEWAAKRAIFLEQRVMQPPSPRSTPRTCFKMALLSSFQNGSTWYVYRNCARFRMFWSLEARKLNCFSPNIKNNFGRTSVRRAYNFDMWSWRKWATTRSAWSVY